MTDDVCDVMAQLTPWLPFAVLLTYDPDPDIDSADRWSVVYRDDPEDGIGCGPTPYAALRAAVWWARAHGAPLADLAASLEGKR